jgi:hypothetical protein
MLVERPTKKYPQFIRIFLKSGPCLAPTLASCLAPHPFLLLIHKVLPKKRSPQKGKPNMRLWFSAMKHYK